MSKDEGPVCDAAALLFSGSVAGGAREPESPEPKCPEPSEPPASQLRQNRSYIRAFIATNYLLGRRGAALADGMPVVDAPSRQMLGEVTEQLSHGVQAQRARVLAAEVGRLMRSLSTQKLK